MAGTTPKGYPYAEPADPLVQWPSTSKALAEAIDDAARPVSGGRYIGSTASDGTLRIPHQLPAAPIGVSLTLTTGMPPALLQICKILYLSADATEITATLWRTDSNGPAGGQPVEVAWVAVGP